MKLSEQIRRAKMQHSRETKRRRRMARLGDGNSRQLPIVATCENCGACCMHMRSPPFIVFFSEKTMQFGKYDGDVSAADYAHLMAAPQEARDTMLLQLYGDAPPDSPCSWFNPETKQCRWHEHRPEVCRDFEVGSADCLCHRKARGIQ